MKKLLFALLFTSSLLAQNEPVLSFVNKESNVGYGGNVYSSKSTKDSAGNTYLVGTFYNLADFDPSATETNLTASNGADGDMYIAKYNATGGFLWAKHISGSGYARCYGIVVGGNFMYLVGKYTNTVDFDPSANTANLTSTNGNNEAGFMTKYDLNGFLVLAKSMDEDPVNPILDFNSISFYNNQIVISGNFSGTVDFDPSVNSLPLASNGSTDIFLAKYSTSFALQWAFNIGGVAGSTDNDTSSSSVIDGQGNIILTGNYVNTVNFNPLGTANTLTNLLSTFNNTYVAKYATTGILLWVKDIGGRRSSLQNSNPKLVTDASNNIIVAGIFNATSDFDPSANIANILPSSTSTFIAKYDTNGNYTWAKKVYLCNNINITLTNTSNKIVIYGTFSSTSDFDPDTPVYNLNTANGTYYFASYDSNGNFIYANNLKGIITTMHANENDGIYLSGYFSGTQDFDPSSNTANLSSLSYSNVFLGKYDTTGAYVYALNIGGNKPANYVNNLIATDGVGNIYRAGGLSATTDLDPTSATYNVSSLSGPGIFISKHTANGNLIWAKTISGDTSLYLYVMNTDTNGNTYITGKFIGTVDFDPSANVANLTNTSTVSSMYMAKYDSNGNYLWAKQIDGRIGVYNTKILFDTAGNFYINGRLSGTDPIDVDPSPSSAVYITPTGNIDVFFAKFSPLGDYIWAKSIAGVDSGSGMNEYCFVIHGNNLYLTGIFYGGYIFNTVSNEVIGSGVTNLSGFIAKYDLDGNYQFTGILTNSDLTSNYQSNGEALAVDDNDDIYLISQFSGTVDFDIDPTTEYNLSSFIDVDANNFSSCAISKYSASGSLLWAKAINGLDLPSGFSFKTTQAFITNNQLMFGNTFTGNVDFDPSTNDYILSTPTDTNGNYEYNLFAAKYDTATGDFIWANKLDSNGSLFLNSACLDNNQNLLISGNFYGSVDFDFSSAVQNVTSTSAYNEDRFWAKYSTSSLGLGENIITKGYSIYPNPTNSELFVSHPQYDAFNITITDITGKVLNTTTLQNNESVNVASYPQGMYFIQVESGNERNTYKFIKK